MLDALLILNSQLWLAPAQDATWTCSQNNYKQQKIIAVRIAVLLERVNFLSEIQEYKNEYITFLKGAITFTNPSNISPQEMWNKILLWNPQTILKEVSFYHRLVLN